MTYRIYMDDPYLKEIKSNILSRKYINGNYHLILDRTIFYPHLLGGQPRDYGTINGLPVLNVFEDKETNEIVHVVKEEISGDKVDLEIDWKRRFDIMQQHTGQHLLSANIFNLYSAETESTHFGDNFSSIIVSKEEFLEREIKQIQYLTNRSIQSNLKILSYYPDKEELEGMPIKKLPNTDEDIRIVEIGDIDFNACCGTHLDSTGELALIKILSWKSIGDSTKIDFVCGNRAIRDYDFKNSITMKINELLECKTDDIIDRIEELINENIRISKVQHNTNEELLNLKAESLLQNASEHNGIKYIVKSLDNFDIDDITVLSNIINKEKDIIQIYNIPNKNKEDSSRFLITKSNNLNINLKDIFDSIAVDYELKGGGTENIVQGIVDSEDIKLIIRNFYSKIRNSLIDYIELK